MLGFEVFANNEPSVIIAKPIRNIILSPLALLEHSKTFKNLPPRFPQKHDCSELAPGDEYCVAGVIEPKISGLAKVAVGA